LKVLAVIPARLHSTRLAKKALIEISGKPLIQWVYEKAVACSAIDKVIVATDHLDIYTACQAFGAAVEMTKEEHPSGTDRVGEVAQRHDEYDLILNIQGDEPFLDPSHIDDLLACFSNENVKIATLAQEIKNIEDFDNPNVVKLVRSSYNKVLYFSRAGIPFDRDKTNGMTALKHVGIYAFRRKTLEDLIQLAESQLEKTERLEQLRWLDNGFDVYCGINNKPLLGIDTQEDLDLFRKMVLQTGRIEEKRK